MLHQSTIRARASLALLVTAAVTAVASATHAAPAPAAVEASNACRFNNSDAYTMTAGALTGPQTTDVTLHVVAAPECPAATAVSHVKITILAADSGHLIRVHDIDDPSFHDGVVEISIARVDPGRQLIISAHVRTTDVRNTYVLNAVATAMLRPDLVVTAVHAPAQTLATRPVDITAEISEINGDTGARAHVALASEIGPLADPIEITVPPGGHTSVTFQNVALTTAVPTDVRVIVADASPGEYDTENDTREATVDVTNDELASSRLLVPSLGGYGFQFNGHLYAPITSAPPETLPTLEAKVKALEPQLVRIFYNENWEANADKTHPEWPQNLESFEESVALAQASGATVVIAYQTITTAKANPALWMSRFADVLQDLVQGRGLTNVRWVSIANEPNSTQLTLAQYEALYRALDAELRARGLRSQLGLIGGDLVENTEGTAASHRAWFDYMVAHMNDVVDAWSEHIYWNYWDHFRMEERLKDVAYLVHTELPASARKPVFLMEYGVRGSNTCGAKPAVTAAYYLDDSCTELRRMSLAAFHKLAFVIASAQLGFEAACNWDLYWAVYDRTKANQSYWTIGPPEEGYALYPTYYAFQLLFQTTAPGWQVIGVDPWTQDDEATRYDHPHPDQPEQELTAYRGPDGQLTVLGLDTNGRDLVAPNGAVSSYSIGGLPPLTTFTLAVWNAEGDGKNSIAGQVTANAAGVARFDVPLQAAFVLTTVAVS